MIDFTNTFEEIKKHIAFICADNMDARSLIFTADNAAKMKALAVSCNIDSVNMLWTWLEQSKINIFARIVIDNDNPDIQKVAAILHGAFKKGATGVQLIASPVAHGKLANALAPIAADLFFGRELILTIDMDTAMPEDFEKISDNIKTLSASGLGLLIGESENTAGAIYGILDTLDSSFCGSLQIISKGLNFNVIEDSWRLIKKMRPELIPGVVFFMNEK